MKKWPVTIFLFFISVWSFSQNQNRRELDSLWSVYNNRNQSDTNRLKAIDNIVGRYTHNNPDSSIVFSELEKQLAEKTKQKRFEGHAFLNMGVAYLNLGNYSKAKEFAAMALKIYEEVGSKKAIANAYANLGVVYFNQSDFSKSLEYYLKALKIREEIGDKYGMGACYINIGNIYIYELNYVKAIEYDSLSMRIWEELGNKQNVGLCQMNLGSVYYKQNDLPKALEYFFKSLKTQEEVGYKPGAGNCFSNIGVIYTTQKNFAKGFEYHFNALKIRKETSDKRGMGNSYDNIGGVYFNTSDFKKALQYYDSALQITREIGDIEEERKACENISNVYAKTGKYKEAYDYYVKFKKLTDSIFNSDNTKQLSDQKTNFEVQKKEVELQAKADAMQSINAEEKKLQKFIIYGVVGILLIVIIFSVFLFKRFRLTNKQKKIIETKSKELERLSIVASETENSILILDADGTLEWVNTSFERLNGMGLEDFKKKYGNTIYELSNNPEIKNIIQKSIDTKTPVRYESANKLEDGRIVWEASTLSPIFNSEGKLSKLIIIDDDITELKRTEEIIKQKNKDITDSITYAKHLQEAILPPLNSLPEIFPESFLLFKPKDIVSGDFYWFSETNDVAFMAIADCTGHGVPGAFMSVIGNEMLNISLHDPSVKSPSSALDMLDKKIKEVFKKGRQQNETQDGMDIGIVVWHRTTNLIQFSGAMRPLLHIRNKVVQEFAGDRISIGGKDDSVEKHFTDKEFFAQPGDMLYLFSDGYPDQFGGEKAKKFLYKNFSKLLCEISDLPMSEQNKKLEQTLSDWKGEHEQVDDISVVGIRIGGKKK